MHIPTIILNNCISYLFTSFYTKFGTHVSHTWLPEAVITSLQYLLPNYLVFLYLSLNFSLHFKTALIFCSCKLSEGFSMFCIPLELTREMFSVPTRWKIKQLPIAPCKFLNKSSQYFGFWNLFQFQISRVFFFFFTEIHYCWNWSLSWKVGMWSKCEIINRWNWKRRFVLSVF